MSSYSDWADAGSAFGPLAALGGVELLGFALPYCLGIGLLISNGFTLWRFGPRRAV
jgi:hypothetical protein